MSDEHSLTKSDILPLQTSWIAHFKGRVLHTLGRIRETEVPPSPSEGREADQILQNALLAAVYGSLGGARPDKENRATSWWGGCFLGAAGEDMPMGRSGKPMQPLLQLRTDEVAIPLPGCDGSALLALWIDLDGKIFEAVEGVDFCIRTYPALDGLVPIGPGYRESDLVPTFPMSWTEPYLDQPTWEDFALQVPQRVAWSDTSDWFFENPVCKQGYELQSKNPVKIGGWPTWIQGAQWEGTKQHEDFVFQVDSNDKGRVGFGDAGSIYLFRDRRSGAWILRCDFF